MLGKEPERLKMEQEILEKMIASENKSKVITEKQPQSQKSQKRTRKI